MKRATQKGRIGIKNKRNNRLSKGRIGLKTNQRISLRKKRYNTLLNEIKKIKDIKKIYFNIKFNKNYTKKGILTRMGKGKGKFQDKLALLPKNKIFLEFTFFNYEDFLFKLKKIIKKFPFLSIILI